ncbi:hypothetical protein A2671_00045 [Candidatus Kaiserbacteria bacterium RIFCSPHIGHO2_01_FULL_49_13]|uniref:Uncharacterized protein n=1 Tax=Candidatus Kaiserbacteria bacterium RIFCSPHIGHO2_01_FULL_49_13 TaxID=1798477 RepID=A0A1F6CD69_9BACT|nr:MAG: hypothetical protein A2671_00045 [Candidatus Kaiserbacteria bacterium RIFCSPHIGHO2_01_FULL_49_13]
MQNIIHYTTKIVILIVLFLMSMVVGLFAKTQNDRASIIEKISAQTAYADVPAGGDIGGGCEGATTGSSGCSGACSTGGGATGV